MNKHRRQRIVDLIKQADSLRDALQTLAYEERDALSNLPSGLQDTDRASEMSDAADALDACNASIEDACDELETALNLDI